MDEEQVVELNVGCRPEAAVSGATLLQSESAVFLLFNAMSGEKNAEGYYEDVGTAVMEFKGCCRTLFGGPNDEALPEHPLYEKGLADFGYSICEVLNSSWAKEVMKRARKSAERIWGDRFEKSYAKYNWTTRHFMVSFHDSTFECLADDFQLSVHKEPYSQILDSICRKLMER
jgi:hypothetical protein